MLDDETDLVRAESLASILQSVHSKLDLLTAGQQQIAIHLGVSPAFDFTVSNDLEQLHANRENRTRRVSGNWSLSSSDPRDVVAVSEKDINSDTAALELHAKQTSTGERHVTQCSAIELNEKHSSTVANHKGKVLALRDFSGANTTCEESMALSPQHLIYKNQGRMKTPRASFGIFTDSSDGRDGVWTRIMSLFPLQKYSKGVLLFDFLGVIILFKDSVQAPYTMVCKNAYYIDGRRTHLVVIAMLSATFWTFDLVLRFVISNEDDHDESADVKTVSMRYLKGWFVVDFILMVLDWVCCIMEAVQGAVPATSLKLTRLLKVSRIMRIGAVVRSQKWSHVKDALMQKLRAVQLLQAVIDLTWNVLRLLMFTVWVSHLGACAWIFLEEEYSQGGQNWEVSVARMHKVDADSFADANLSQTYRYSIAYYWALTTMFSAASFLPPMTTAECWFASFSALFGVLSVTTIISSTSAMVMGMKEANRERLAKADMLRTFLRQHNIPPLLSLQIQRQAKERSVVETRVAEEDVRIISLLSAELRDQLRFNLYAPVLRGRPLWRACDYIDGRMIGAMCSHAISFKMCTPGEIVFEEHCDVDASYTLVWGSLKYSWVKRNGMSGTWSNFSESNNLIDGAYGRVALLPGHTACENALWTEWQTVGFLEAVTRCEMLVCSATGLATVVQKVGSAAKSIMRGYAQAVIDFTVLEQDTHLSDVSTRMDYDSIVTFMSEESRVIMSMPALKALRKDLYGRTWFAMEEGVSSVMQRSASSADANSRPVFMTNAQVSAIEKEVRDGRCNLGQDEQDRVLRIVRMVVVSLRRTDGLICVEVGEVQHGTNIPRIRLPGRKCRTRETFKECAKQLIRKHFAAFASDIALSYGAVDVEVKPSESYSIPTKYIRLSVDAIIHDTGLLAGTTAHLCSWGKETIECFAWRDVDDLSVVIYAWMTHDQYGVLKDLEKDGESLVASWMDEFTATEIADARLVL